MNKIKQAVILAGGEGKRLRPFTENNPKPMIPVNGRPFLEHLIEMLKEQGIQEVVILAGYLGEKIKDYFLDGSRFGIKIKYSFTPFKNEKGEELESGLRLKNAEPLLDDHFLLMYCDNYWPLLLDRLEKFYQERQTDISLTAYSNKDNFTKNNVLIGKEGAVLKYDRKREDQNLNGVEIGFFIMNKKVIGELSKENSHFERDTLPRLISQKRVSGFLTDHRYYSISTPERVKITEDFLKPKKVIFLDRDGVINKKPARADYVKTWQEFEFLPGAIQGLKELCERGYSIYLITNQPGIGRGMMKKEDLGSIHEKMQEELQKQGARVDKIYYCPHAWEENCDCRKPRPGLLFQAARENNLDLTKIVFIGDDERDEQAGKAAGCQTVLLEPGKGLLDAVNNLFN